jgi:hypothetical protein
MYRSKTGTPWKSSEQSTVNSQQWTVDSEQWTVDSEQSTVDSRSRHIDFSSSQNAKAHLLRLSTRQSVKESAADSFWNIASAPETVRCPLLTGN